MRKKTLKNAKLIIRVEGNKKNKTIKTISVFDNRTQRFLDDDFIEERNIVYFLNLYDLKETLNWNLNGDSSKFQLKWGQSNNIKIEGLAYIFD